jgi:23S rRNA (cytidine1920-2'-O)/16S rRNA (cytidine1409-2'-O)-methyltransferase
VYAIDVGYGQLASKIATDSRVVVIDRQNIRTMDSSLVPDRIDLAVMDVSFISLERIFPAVNSYLAKGAKIVALVKPQFELGKEDVGAGGVVENAALHEKAVEKAKAAGTALGWSVLGCIQSPICGAKGNVEFLVFFIKL